MSNYTIYIRVSTQRQFDSHLGLDAQTKTCKDYIASVNGTLDNIFVDAESGKSRTRKGLWDAIEHCKNTGSTLVIAKLDRLARDVEFTFKVINTGISIHFVDMPVVNTMILGVFASVAQYERELISSRTKASLKAKKEREGSWSSEYGKNTNKNRSDVMREAQKARVANQKEEARNNPNNKSFLNALKLYEQRNGYLGCNCDIMPFVNELNALGFKTATGLEFTKPRALAMLKKVRELYDYHYAV